MLGKGPSHLPLAIWKQATHKNERPWCTTKNGTGGLLQIIKCQIITFATKTKSKKVPFQELSYHGVNIIFYTHGQFKNLYLPTKKYSERLVSIFHDLDLFSLNVNSNIDPYYDAFYKITKIICVLWLAERRICMRVCKHSCDIKIFCLFARLSCKHEFEKGFELKNSTSLLYLPIFSYVETWKIFRNMLCQFAFPWADILSKKNLHFGKHLFCKTKTESDYAYKLRVQDLATFKNFSFNQSSKQESFALFSRERYFIKAIENFFPVFAYPDINTQGVGRILNSYANPRLHLRFA